MLGLLYYPPIMKNQMENEMETAGRQGFKELESGFHCKETLIVTML